MEQNSFSFEEDCKSGPFFFRAGGNLTLPHRISYLTFLLGLLSSRGMAWGAGQSLGADGHSSELFVYLSFPLVILSSSLRCCLKIGRLSSQRPHVPRLPHAHHKHSTIALPSDSVKLTGLLAREVASQTIPRRAIC